jgi:hypothetical protein
MLTYAGLVQTNETDCRVFGLRGTHFTCFTGTKVQILTQMALLDAGRYGNESISCSARINLISSDIEIHITKDVKVLSLLALLVQNYKY